jgi:branched-chain amino acid transport system substrate-binding protein
MLQAIKTAAAGGTPTRQTVAQAVDKLDYKGITTQIKFDATGEVDQTAQVVNLFQQEGGKIKLLGNIKEQG